MKQKTHKALSKRITVTKGGKLKKRHAGQDHFNTRASGKITRKKRRDNDFSKTHKKAVKELMPYS